MKKMKFLILLLFPLTLCAQETEQIIQIPKKQTKVAYHLIVDAGYIPFTVQLSESDWMIDLLSFNFLLSNNIIINEKFGIGIGGGVNVGGIIYLINEDKIRLRYPIFGNFRYYFNKPSHKYSPFINVALGTSLTTNYENNSKELIPELYSTIAGGFKFNKFQINLGFLFTTIKETQYIPSYFEIGCFVSIGVAL
jgi:hypothetical protein